MIKHQAPNKLSWAKFALCATVFLPGFACATTGLPTLAEINANPAQKDILDLTIASAFPKTPIEIFEQITTPEETHLKNTLLSTSRETGFPYINGLIVTAFFLEKLLPSYKKPEQRQILNALIEELKKTEQKFLLSDEDLEKKFNKRPEIKGPTLTLTEYITRNRTHDARKLVDIRTLLSAYTGALQKINADDTSSGAAE